MTSYSKLFEPTNIGAVTLKNRIVMLPMATRMGGPNGEVTQRIIDYYAERARGGVGLIIVECTQVDVPRGKNAATSLSIDSDKLMPEWNELAEAIHDNGVKAAVQINHAGRRASTRWTEGEQPVSASDTPWRDPKGHAAIYGTHPYQDIHALTYTEIDDIVEKYAESVLRTKCAGFDTVELQGSHEYLIAQFLSPYSNFRKDKYGGTLERRMTFALEVIERCREKVGNDFPIIFRMNATEFFKGGYGLDEGKIFAKRLEEAGIDALDVDRGGDPELKVEYQPGWAVYLAETIKKVVNIPIIACCKINDPTLAEEILHEGKADLVGLGRLLIADPQASNKWFEGRLSDVRQCIYCRTDCCRTRIDKMLHIRCAVNAAVGREGKYRIISAEKPKRILVVGGGPAGMEAARVAALRGHDVTLFEKKEELGGQLTLASVSPYKQDVNYLSRYLSNQIRKLGVKIELGKEVDQGVIDDIKPDAVILATGAVPLVPKIQGIDRKNVVIGWNVLSGKVELENLGGEVIVAGGGDVGCEIADFLAEKGKKVIVVEMLDDIVTDYTALDKRWLLERFDENKVKVLTGQKITEITDKGIVVINKEWVSRSLVADTVVLALGSVANRKLAEKLKGKVPELYDIGDCVEPRSIMDAIWEGSRVSLSL